MQEQAINTFEEGLVMDLNPLTTPNNVLTNCLNGTYISFNGNEFVLQNDMGNGRVETAYLPSGYMPVGIKEYGGIIYVASYNPITNKGQIGSFPSPERNISSEELKSPEKILTPDSFNFKGRLDGDFLVSDTNNPQGAKSFISTMELLEDDLLRPGDKFALRISDQNHGSTAQSTWNYLNTILTGIDRNDNNILTLKVCIMDSNGNLIDITNSLKRYIFENGEFRLALHNEDPDLDEIKNKDGFYMQSTAYSSISDKESIEDSRNSEKFMNVYNNKISGKLYLVAELPTINSSNLIAEGTKDMSSNSSEVNLTSEYEMVESNIEPNFMGTIWEYWVGSNPHIKEYQYYNGGHTQKFNIPNIPHTKGMFNYIMTPCMTFGELSLFKKQGFLNLDLLGTGTIELQGWQFYTDLQNKYTKVRFNMSSYPKEGTKVSEVKFSFYDYKYWIKNNKNFESCPKTKLLPNRSSWHGEFEVTLYHGIDLEPRTMYIVLITLTTREIEGVGRWYTLIPRILLTTSMFNEEYINRKKKDFSEYEQKKVQFLSDLNLKNNMLKRIPSFPNEGKYPPKISNAKGTSYSTDYQTQIDYSYSLHSTVKIEDSNWYIFDVPANLKPTWEPGVKGTNYDIKLIDGTLNSNNQQYLDSDITPEVVGDVLNVQIIQHNPITGKYDNEITVTNGVLTPYFQSPNKIYGYASPKSNKYPRAALGMMLHARKFQSTMYMYKYSVNENTGSGFSQIEFVEWNSKNEKDITSWSYYNKSSGDTECNLRGLLDELLPSEIYTLNVFYLDGTVYNSGGNQNTSELQLSEHNTRSAPYALLFWRNPDGTLLMFRAYYPQSSKQALDIDTLLKPFRGIITRTSDTAMSKIFSVKDPNYLESFTDKWYINLLGTVPIITDFPISDELNYSAKLAEEWVGGFKKKFPKAVNMSTNILTVFNNTNISAQVFSKEERSVNISKFIDEISSSIYDGSIVVDWDGNTISNVVNASSIDPNSIYYYIDNKLYRVKPDESIPDVSPSLMTFLRGLSYTSGLAVSMSITTGNDRKEDSYPKIKAKGQRNANNSALWFAPEHAGKYNLDGDILSSIGFYSM